ncbi:unnamed protein product [Calypogeia fissa]
MRNCGEAHCDYSDENIVEESVEEDHDYAADLSDCAGYTDDHDRLVGKKQFSDKRSVAYAGENHAVTFDGESSVEAVDKNDPFVMKNHREKQIAETDSAADSWAAENCAGQLCTDQVFAVGNDV